MKRLIKLVFVLAVIAVIFLVAARSIYKIEYISVINNECSLYDVEPVEVLSIIKAESNFKPDAASHKNAIGLMQITLETANWCASKMGIGPLSEADLYVPETNIKIGTFYYSYLLKRYNNFNAAICAYNAGLGNVDDWLKDTAYSPDGITINSTPYRETTRYLAKISNNIEIYKLLYKEL